MQVLEHTDYVLRLRDRPRLLWLIGSLFVIVGVPIFLAFGHHELVCQRQAEPFTCVLTNSYALRQQRITIPLTALGQATVSRDIDSDGDTTYRVELLAANQTIPFGIFSSDYDDRHRTAARINQFLAQPSQPQLRIVQDERWIGGLVLGLTLAVGGGMIILPPVVNLELDRTCGTWTLQRRSLLGRQKQEYRLQEIKDIFLESSDSSEGDSTYRIVIQLQSGEIVPVRQSYSSGRKSKQDTVERLREFLHLPPPLTDGRP